MRYHLHTLPSTYPRRKRFLLTPPLFKPILGCKWHVGNNLALKIQASKNQCTELLLQKKQKHWAYKMLRTQSMAGNNIWKMIHWNHNFDLLWQTWSASRLMRQLCRLKVWGKYEIRVSKAKAWWFGRAYAKGIPELHVACRPEASTRRQEYQLVGSSK